MKKSSKIKFTSLKPIDWGEGSENTSTQIDEIIYG